MGRIQTKKRIDWIDCAKGITIMLVILGHTVRFDTEAERLIRGGIFSFHMPLFFILSCATFRFSEDTSQYCSKLKKAFRHLVIPVFILYGIRIAVFLIKEQGDIHWSAYIADRINALVFSSGVEVNISGGTVSALGMLWFLVALFVGRSLFDLLHLKLRTVPFFILIGICTAAGLILGSIQWLPLSFDVVLAIMPFFLFSIVIKKADIKNKALLWLFVTLAVWGLTFAYSYYVHNTYLELSVRRYPLFPLCYVTAIAGTMFVSYSSVFISKLGFFGKGIVWLGKNSIYLFCVHELDGNISFLWQLTGNKVSDGFIRIAVDIAFCIVVANIANLISMKLNRIKE